jgi:hypothetical protein
MMMKTLTLTQPWATLVAIGAKKIETRSWSTNYRGPLAIHAAKGFSTWAKEECWDVDFCVPLNNAGYKIFDMDTGATDLPLGAVIATCELVDVIRIYADTDIPGKPELMFGDYTVGRYMWKLENVVCLPEPIPAKGSLGLWEWSR